MLQFRSLENCEELLREVVEGFEGVVVERVGVEFGVEADEYEGRLCYLVGLALLFGRGDSCEFGEDAAEFVVLG